MTNKLNTVLYTGVTNDLSRRIWEHKNGEGGYFTKKYNCHKLVYFDYGDDINGAIAYEKQIKNWKRKWKIELIERDNPHWEDLSKDFGYE